MNAQGGFLIVLGMLLGIGVTNLWTGDGVAIYVRSRRIAYGPRMLIRREVLEAIAAVRITTLFRTWRKPLVRAGGTQRTTVGVLAIDSVEPQTLATVTDEDARVWLHSGAGVTGAPVTAHPSLTDEMPDRLPTSTSSDGTDRPA